MKKRKKKTGGECQNAVFFSCMENHTNDFIWKPHRSSFVVKNRSEQKDHNSAGRGIKKSKRKETKSTKANVVILSCVYFFFFLFFLLYFFFPVSLPKIGFFNQVCCFLYFLYSFFWEGFGTA